MNLIKILLQIYSKRVKRNNEDLVENESQNKEIKLVILYELLVNSKE